ncbi:MAG: 4-hydroxythreonine-4-phosphate dehydrogenase PdxA [Paludibacter sp.]|jgi:4-hydroxythreonine-4-phosphate dehydrogenase|nr:4-hydroxythreonine-4-phosphate dehydrogenase PdxA [Paludibacter sp.]
MEKNKITIGITQGDINGIGWEVILKTLDDAEILEMFTPIIYGSLKAATYYKNLFDLQAVNFNQISNATEAAHRKINIINCNKNDILIEPGQSSEQAGKAAFEALERATSDLKANLITALVTAPINKKNIQSADFNFAGHTEYLQKKADSQSTALMLLINDMMRVAVVTAHVPVENVSKLLTKDLIVKKIEVFNQSLKRDFMIVSPRIAVLSLNPHAGDQGVIGHEEQNVIIPAINQAIEQGIVCAGPYSADGFFGAGKFSSFDGVLAMYHDQGLIPFKTLSMDSGVNFTAALPFVRTSPDHGTAYDIAGKNEASPQSFRHACFAAIDIIRNRKTYSEITQNPLKIEVRAEQNGRIA